MEKRRSMHWLLGFISVLLILGVPSIGRSESESILSKFHPYITVSEEYNNNINLTPTRLRISDYITTVTAGLKFNAVEEKKYGIDLDITGGYVFYARNHDYNYANPTGSLNAWYAATPRLTFRIRDYFVRSDAAKEEIYSGDAQPYQYLLSTQKIHAIYIRNVVEPSVEYQFSKAGLISVLYRNNIYLNENIRYEDSMENTINPRLTYSFDVNNVVSLDYYLTKGDYQRSPDQLAQGLTPRYTYRINPRTSIFGEYRFEWQNFKSPGVDYYVHNPSFGIQYQFSPTLSGLAQVGWWFQNPKKGEKENGPSFNLSLTKTTQRTTYTLAFRGGYTEDYFSAENRGFTETYSLYGTINHQLTQKLKVGVTGYVQREKYSSIEKSWEWEVAGNASYPLLKWLTLSLQVSYTENHSNIDLNDYTQCRGILSVTATF